ncbi:hypothetical protein CNYM01_01883 [Colletotrichum nymphaeae SA-01]|uniref:BZIP domain-containing protein n=1 Tax=Colletotrichum nymphaeae SA-01 TaxID=1460502 RepID=A0A135TYK7_9PEZI|nr:hypothetical protein CNYM01_01883 [Colletotrichum nymphaeae SA-01]
MDQESHASNATSSEDIKKLRNRLSQQAFRRRRADLIRDLRERADNNNTDESETLAKTRRENAALREQLAEAHAKLNSLLARVQALVLNTAPRLGDANDEAPRTESTRDQTSHLEPILDSQAMSADLLPESQSVAPMQPAEPELGQENGSQPISDPSVLLNSCGMTHQVPNIWSFEYQMGPHVYHDALVSSQDLGFLRRQIWVDSNSSFSDHINFIHQEIQRRTELPNSQLSTPLLYLATTSALSMFHTIAREDVMFWYTKTKFYHTRDISVWKLRPCEETFNRLHPQYQPTLLQLQCEYPAVIDWLPFPSIRDCLIRYHAANPCIDQVVSDIVGMYVVEALLSDFVVNSPPMQVYIKVADLVQAMGTIDCGDASERPVSLPTFKATDIFDMPSVAWAAANHLQIESRLERYKLDPRLFIKHPEFLESAEELMAQGTPLRPEYSSCLSFPASMDTKTASSYRNFIAFTCFNV